MRHLTVVLSACCLLGTGCGSRPAEGFGPDTNTDTTADTVGDVDGNDVLDDAPSDAANDAANDTVGDSEMDSGDPGPDVVDDPRDADVTDVSDGDVSDDDVSDDDVSVDTPDAPDDATDVRDTGPDAGGCETELSRVELLGADTVFYADGVQVEVAGGRVIAMIVVGSTLIIRAVGESGILAQATRELGGTPTALDAASDGNSVFVSAWYETEGGPGTIEVLEFDPSTLAVTSIPVELPTGVFYLDAVSIAARNSDVALAVSGRSLPGQTVASLTVFVAGDGGFSVSLHESTFPAPAIIDLAATELGWMLAHSNGLDGHPISVSIIDDSGELVQTSATTQDSERINSAVTGPITLVAGPAGEAALLWDDPAARLAYLRLTRLNADTGERIGDTIVQRSTGWFETVSAALAFDGSQYVAAWSDIRDTLIVGNYDAPRAPYMNFIDQRGRIVGGADASPETAADYRLSDVDDADVLEVDVAAGGDIRAVAYRDSDGAAFVVFGDLGCAPLVQDHIEQRP